MAIYQFHIELIPKIGLLKKHGEIPKQIKFNTEREFFEFDTNEYWELASFFYNNIESDIDKIVNKANYGNENFNWKTYANELDNDAGMYINSDTKEITELSFRTDLREPNLTFLKEMIKLAKKYEMVLMDRKYNIIEPNFDELNQFLKASNAYKFLQNPRKFFKDLEEGKINIE